MTESVECSYEDTAITHTQSGALIVSTILKTCFTMCSFAPEAVYVLLYIAICFHDVT